MNRLFYPSRSGAGTHRSGKYTLWVAAAFTVLLLVASATDSYGLRADFSEEGLYSLSDKTILTVGELPSDIQIYTLYSPGNDDRTVYELLNAYRAKSKRISVVNVNPSGARRELERFEGYESFASGTIIVASNNNDRYRALTAGELYYTLGSVSYFNAEARITGAIEYVLTGEESKVYLLSGHREADAEELNTFADMLGASSIGVAQLDILKGTQTPDPSRDAIFIVSPGQDLSSDEEEYLRSFLSEGGSVALLADSSKYAETGESHPNLDRLLSGFGISLSPDRIYDADASKTGLTQYVIELERSTAAGGGALVLSDCSPVYSAGAQLLLETSATAYTNRDKSAPFAVGVANGGLTVITSSSFLTGKMPEDEKNASFIRFILKRAGIELGEQPAPKRIQAAPMTVSHGIVQVMLAMALLVLLPGAVLFTGVYIVKRRRESAG